LRAAIDKLNLGEYAAQSFGTSNTALIRLPLKEGVSSAQLERVMNAEASRSVGEAAARRVRRASGRQGAFENGALALLLVSLGIVGYLAMRFEWRSPWPPSSPICTTW
jgi:preprotein translocase subunit SecF